MKLTEEQKKLVEENHNLIYGFLRMKELEDDEYYDIVAYGLCKAAMKYDSTKGKFSTFAYKYMKTEIVHQIDLDTRKNKIPKNLIYSYDNVINTNPKVTFISMLFDRYDENAIDAFISEENFRQFYLLLKKEEQFIINHFANGYNGTEVANKMDITSQRVYQRIKDIRRKWKEYNEKGYIIKRKRGRKKSHNS